MYLDYIRFFDHTSRLQSEYLPPVVSLIQSHFFKDSKPSSCSALQTTPADSKLNAPYRGNIDSYSVNTSNEAIKKLDLQKESKNLVIGRFISSLLLRMRTFPARIFRQCANRKSDHSDFIKLGSNY